MSQNQISQQINCATTPMAPVGKNALLVIYEVIKDIQIRTGHVTRIETTINLEGLNVMVRIFNNTLGKVYGIDRNIPLQTLQNGVPQDCILNIRNAIFKAIEEAEKNASTEGKGTGNGKKG